VQCQYHQSHRLLHINIIGTASVLAGIALKQVIDHVGGKVVVLGCPAEEGGENGSCGHMHDLNQVKHHIQLNIL
jgi:metal-dependent amidase/aminoacylase/carboxypeptidase family protein